MNDRLKFIREAVQSILDQTYTKFDYYIIFDGPVEKDIDSYIESLLKDERIRLYRLEKNGGLAAALNYLLEIVLKNPEYNLIARMDADDISMPDRFEKQFSFLNSNPDISVVGCWYEEIDETGKHLSYKKLPIEHESVRKRYFTRTPFAHPSVIYRRELIEKAGVYPTDTILMEDNVLWGRALMKGLRFYNIPEYLFKFRIDKDFYKRRSGINYGFNFAKGKSAILREIRSPIVYILLAYITGCIKMLPPFFIRHIYSSLK